MSSLTSLTTSVLFLSLLCLCIYNYNMESYVQRIMFCPLNSEEIEVGKDSSIELESSTSSPQLHSNDAPPLPCSHGNQEVAPANQEVVKQGDEDDIYDDDDDDLSDNFK